MALVKKIYTDNQTVITAENLNDIQDEIIANAGEISSLNEKIEAFHAFKASSADNADTIIATLESPCTYIAYLTDGSGMINGFKGTESYQRQTKMNYWGNVISSRVKTNSNTWSDWVDLALKSDLVKSQTPFSKSLTYNTSSSLAKAGDFTLGVGTWLVYIDTIWGAAQPKEISILDNGYANYETSVSSTTKNTARLALTTLIPVSSAKTFEVWIRCAATSSSTNSCNIKAIKLMDTSLI